MSINIFPVSETWLVAVPRQFGHVFHGHFHDGAAHQYVCALVLGGALTDTVPHAVSEDAQDAVVVRPIPKAHDISSCGFDSATYLNGRQYADGTLNLSLSMKDCLVAELLTYKEPGMPAMDNAGRGNAGNGTADFSDITSFSPSCFLLFDLDLDRAHF
jgi:hypothetical protein